MSEFRSRATELDGSDDLAGFRSEFVEPRPGRLRAYLDGNSLGRPLRRTAPALTDLVEGSWGAS
ncbi:hypothetical protein GCM10025872_25290 [Barrientosiimonas endolithica]|uniref:Uncharacterized protein n=1 Tax=Barrientosiimonas endolithica TaxID=1535208 RepID=A0ABM8HDC2_9MICO|nr:hypothetical protein GCM10025872_25290 [Barrientosiimonas endolithica]